MILENLNFLVVEADKTYARLLSAELTSRYPGSSVSIAGNMKDAAQCSRSVDFDVIIGGANELGDGFAFLNNICGQQMARVMLTSQSDTHQFIPKNFVAVPAYRIEPIIDEIERQVNEFTQKQPSTNIEAPFISSLAKKTEVLIVDTNAIRACDLESRLFLTYGDSVKVSLAFSLDSMRNNINEKQPDILIVSDDENNNAMAVFRNPIVKSSANMTKILFLEQGVGTEFVKAQARLNSATIILQPEYAKLVEEVGKNIGKAQSSSVQVNH